ncbi:MAG: epoxyqueuosine reductase QueH [Bacilli bacterium]|nr:epoxyqueuosine reductase QueH [Bacilli bacterium]MDD4808807.1 epoxyqueuosine reductase QueH [Bacilli bacterium]
MKKNYQIILEEELNKIMELDKKPTLLLHVCCAPCSTYVLEYLSNYFDITIFYYNPNIAPTQEYYKRLEETKRFISEFKDSKIKLIVGDYEDALYNQLILGLESEPEGGRRCLKCYSLRLEKTVEMALKHKFDYFTTTLSVSPYKDADVLNNIGQNLAHKYQVKYLFSDFKKKNGYQRSIELSQQYHLYRQDYCGCLFSIRKDDLR